MIPPFIFFIIFFITPLFIYDSSSVHEQCRDTARVPNILAPFATRRWDVNFCSYGRSRPSPVDPLIYPPFPPPLALLAFYELVGLVCLKSPVV